MDDGELNWRLLNRLKRPHPQPLLEGLSTEKGPNNSYKQTAQEPAAPPGFFTAKHQQRGKLLEGRGCGIVLPSPIEPTWCYPRHMAAITSVCHSETCTSFLTYYISVFDLSFFLSIANIFWAHTMDIIRDFFVCTPGIQGKLRCGSCHQKP